MDSEKWKSSKLMPKLLAKYPNLKDADWTDDPPLNLGPSPRDYNKSEVSSSSHWMLKYYSDSQWMRSCNKAKLVVGTAALSEAWKLKQEHLDKALIEADRKKKEYIKRAVEEAIANSDLFEIAIEKDMEFGAYLSEEEKIWVKRKQEGS